MTTTISIITGAGSGIGRALALAQARMGITIVAVDIDSDAAKRTAEECGNGSWATTLDVRERSAVEGLIGQVMEKYNRIDYLFNNAGIGIGGETYEIDHTHWERIIDINIKGVLNGVLAVYPIMVKQGFGHIINTASLAGLGPAPLLAPYGMTKHAVVGLSTSLRIEAKKFGVRVTVLCPAAIETPLLDSMNPTDLKNIPWSPDIRRFLTNLAGPPFPADRFAAAALRGIDRNKSVVVIPARARFAWRLGRLFPRLVEAMAGMFVEVERKDRKN